MHPQHAHGVGERPAEGIKKGKRPDADAAPNQENTAYQQNRNGQRLGNPVDIRAEFQPQQGSLGIGRLIGFIFFVKLRYLIVFPGKGFHHPVSGDVPFPELSYLLRGSLASLANG